MFYSISLDRTYRENDYHYNTWDNWHLVPTSRPLVNPPEARVEYLEVPNGAPLDFTEALNGLKFKNREGSWEFLVLGDYENLSGFDGDNAWWKLFDDIKEKLNGYKFEIRLESDPGYYYIGRIYVNDWVSAKDNSTLTLSYIIEPYKYPESTTRSNPWLWNDLFNLDIYYGPFYVDGSKHRNIMNPTNEVIYPIVNVVSAMRAETELGTTYNFPARSSTKIMPIYPGDNKMVFYGNGQVILDYSTGRTF